MVLQIFMVWSTLGHLWTMLFPTIYLHSLRMIFLILIVGLSLYPLCMLFPTLFFAKEQGRTPRESSRLSLGTSSPRKSSPANALQTLKSTLQMISSPHFVQLHLKTYNHTRIRVFIPQDSGMMIECKLNFDEETTRTTYPPGFRGRNASLLGSCDGLLCMQIGGMFARRPIAVYNPSTGKYVSVQLCQPLTYVANRFWFGHHPSSGEYVLVLGNFHYEVGVYKFSDEFILEPVCSTPCVIDPRAVFSHYEERGVLCRGALHWPAKWFRGGDAEDSRHVICAYHLEDNKYFEILPPVQCDFKLGVDGEGCLFATFKSGSAFEMWMMKEEQCWTKCASIEGFSSNRVLFPLGFFPNGDLVLDGDKARLIKYSFSQNKAVHLKDHVLCRSEAVVCADSLVSPTIVLAHR